MAIRVSGQRQKHGASLADDIAKLGFCSIFSVNPFSEAEARTSRTNTHTQTHTLFRSVKYILRFPALLHQHLSRSIMVRRSIQRNADTGLRRRLPKRQATTNARWMHLGAGETSILYALQAMTGTTAQHYVVYLCLLAVLVAVRNNNNHINMIAVDTVIEALLHGPVVSFEALLAVFRVVDCVLFDIPLDDEGQPLQMSATRHLRIDDLSDPEAIRLTRFSHEQLCALYGYFGFEALLDPGEVTLRIPTGHFTRNSPCYYRVHPEEAFLFTMIKVATGLTNQHIVDNYFGGDYARWSKTYPFVLRYIDTRYEHIIGYAGLVRFVAEFPRYNAAIETYV
jgi:hypothetical protein